MIFRASIVTFFLAILSVSQSAVARHLEGTVTVGGQPVSGATVTLWKTAGKALPASLSEVTTGKNGGFKIRHAHDRADGHVFYLTTSGGATNGLALMSVLGTDPGIRSAASAPSIEV